ncbi:MAG: MBL fold metallo-hydrolase [Microgenomates group bacterium]|jgi:glyoxylase-like metal-dependent hydrolase (beta-lactamase superfamily II)
MKINTLVVGSLKTNCYLVTSGGEVGIIDPGDDADYIIREIQKENFTPVWIALTHGHFDHVLAVSELCLAFSIPFYMHPEDEFLLDRAKETAEHFTGVYADPVLVKFKDLKEGMKLKVGKEELVVIETPGHTPGGICLYSKSEKALFCGDLIFDRGTVGRTDFKYASEESLEKSIKKVMKLPNETVVYPGHSDKTTVFSHKKTRT